jgi:hypothetical protein
VSDARVVISADASAVERAMAIAKQASLNFASELTSSVGFAVRSVTSGLADVALSAGKVSFSAQHHQVREFEAATARMAVATNRDLESVRTAAEATGREIGKRPGEVNEWASQVGRLTYNFEGAEKGLKGFAALAASTNRSADDYRDLAVELGGVGHVAGDSSHALGVMQSQAEMTGTSMAAFADNVSGLTDVISHFAGKAPEDFLRVTAAAAVLGKGLNPLAAARVEQRALGYLQGNIVAHERYLGHSITDEQGHIINRKDMNPGSILLELRDKVLRETAGSGTEKRRKARNDLAVMLGNDMETASALMNASSADMTAAMGAKPSTKQQQALAAYMQTDAGKRDSAQVELSISSRDLLKSSSALGKAADALQTFAAKNPIASTLATTAGSTFLGSLLGGGGIKSILTAGGKLGGGIVTGGGGLAAAGGGAIAGFAAAALAAGAAGVGGTMLLDKKTHLTDWISGETAHKLLKSESDQSGHAERMKQLIAVRDATKLQRAAHPDWSPEQLKQAVIEGFKHATINVTNASDTAITAAQKSSNSAAAGQQHGG